MFIHSTGDELLEESPGMTEDQKFSRTMTVAQIREPGEVMFLESARFYKVPEEDPAAASMMAILREAKRSGSAVKVVLRSIDSDVIEDVKPAGN